MAQRFTVGERVSSAFIRFEGATMVTYSRYGTVVRLERGMPVVAFDGWRTEKMSRSNCLPVEPELVRRLAATDPSELNATQVELLAHNQILLEGGS